MLLCNHSSSSFPESSIERTRCQLHGIKTKLVVEFGSFIDWKYYIGDEDRPRKPWH